MKKQYLIIGAILLAILIVAVLRGNEDDWICVNGEWVKHGNPYASKPLSGCGEKNQKDIIVNYPQPNGSVGNPLAVEGQARGNWFFEAVFPVRVLDDKGKELGRGTMQALSDWMTSDLVPFKGEVNFRITGVKNGILVLEKDNPSGLPENAGKIEIPILFSSIETIKVKAYFNNEKFDPEASCNKVFAVEREFPKTEAVARAALEELLKGPYGDEKDDGFFTSINAGVKIQKLVIEGGVAKADFSDALEFQVGGSCRVSAIRAQITQTLKQFPTVQSVIISINGRTEDILQP